MTRILCILFAFAVVTLIGCGDGGVGPEGEVVGGACSQHGDCDRGSYCNEGGDFPGGVCTAHCDTDDDCPAETVCIKKDDGICLLLCEINGDCRGGYLCTDVDRKQGGKDFVCIAD